MPKNLLLFVLAGIMGFLAFQAFTRDAPVRQVTISEFHAAVDSGKIGWVKVSGQYLVGLDKDGKDRITAYTAEPWVVTKRLQAKKIPYREVPQQPTFASMLLQFFFSIVLPVALFIFLLRMIMPRPGGGGLNPKQKMEASAKVAKRTKVTFADVAGIPEAIAEVKGLVTFLKDPKRFTSKGARVPRGVLLVGEPGCGKTLLARAVAGEAGVPFFDMSGSQFVEMYVGVGASRVRELFETARKHAPSIIFIDEIDAVGRARHGAITNGGHDEQGQTLNQILTEMDGFAPSEGVIVLAATNKPDVLDPALVRAGRFDRRVVVPLPDVKGREAILRVHTKNKPLDPSVDLAVVAKGTIGLSGADLETIANEAAIAIGEDGRDTVTQEDFMRARDKQVMGPERRAAVMSMREREMTAYHEAGHALTGWFSPHADPVHRVSIVPRGNALGVTWSAPDNDRYGRSKAQLFDTIVMALGGRAAEELIYGEEGITTGASNDLERVTAIATMMVKRLGMIDKIGLRTFDTGAARSPFGGEHDYGQGTAQRIDESIKKIIDDAYARAKQILSEKRDTLEALKNMLIEKETVDETDLHLLAGPKAVHHKA